MSAKSGRKSRKKGNKASKKLNLRHFLVNKLRRISYQWPSRKEAIKKSRVARGKYKCAICEGQDFGPKDIQLDHIDPVIDPHKGFTNWDDYINRLFCATEGYQTLCRVCHSAKSHLENNIRSQVKNKDKLEDDI